jgi:GGDEF domain-containing protein
VTVNRLMVGYVVVAVAAGLMRSWWPIGALLLLGLVTAVVLAAAPRLYPAKDAAAWLAMAASAVVFTAADVINTPWAAPPARPASFLYVPAYLLNALALVRLTRHTGRSGGFWDVSVLATGLVVLLIPVLAVQVTQADTTILAWLYPLADLVLLALAVRLARASPSPSSWLLIAAAVWLLASGFLVVGVGYASGAWLLPTLHAGFLACLGLAALWPAQLAPAAYKPYRDPPVWLFALVVLLVPAALLIQAVIDGDAPEDVLAVACAAAGWFVVARLVSVARATARDPVTGLVMRTVLWAKAREMLAAGRTPTLFLVEMHQFHAVCETVGHRESIEVLRRITQRLVRTAGDALVARSSSGGFSALADLPATGGGADQLAAGLMAAVASPLTVEGKRLQIPCSLGYATADASGDFDDLLVNTEIALHAATDARANTLIAYDPRLRTAELESANLTAELREAIDAGQLLLEYQPIVVLADGVIAGFEALVRWQHPRLGRLGPDRFVPLAESSGLIGVLGAWVDKMFVTALRPGGPAQMVSGILQIADSLGLDVVAEGIERTSERDLLAKLGCRLGQGYLYSRPVELAQARAMVLAGSIIK